MISPIINGTNFLSMIEDKLKIFDRSLLDGLFGMLLVGFLFLVVQEDGGEEGWVVDQQMEEKLVDCDGRVLVVVLQDYSVVGYVDRLVLLAVDQVPHEFLAEKFVGGESWGLDHTADKIVINQSTKGHILTTISFLSSTQHNGIFIQLG